jgi:hypothetical protein
VERPPYWTRARKRIWRETLGFIRGRVIPLSIGITGLAVGFLINYAYLHMQTAKELFLIGTGSLVSSYIIFVLGSLILNALRVPWLLDADAGEQIDTLEKKAQAAETVLFEVQSSKREQDKLQNLFGKLLSEGEALADELRRGVQNYAPWLEKRKKWVADVSQALTDINLPTEATGFRQAGEKDLPIFPPGTAISPRLYYDLYNDQLTGYRTKLQEIVGRRFS